MSIEFIETGFLQTEKPTFLLTPSGLISRALYYRQQLNLMKLLSKVEDMELTEDDVSINASIFENKKPTLPLRNNLVKPSTPVQPNSGSSVDGSTAPPPSSSQQVDKPDGDKVPGSVSVCLEIISNWGHADLVGLTEVCFVYFFHWFLNYT